ncbi:MAG: hypothetical protein PHY16_14330 [Methylobacter sp.]|nr:hypothetical protein [Methylobacter sp.]
MRKYTPVLLLLLTGCAPEPLIQPDHFDYKSVKKIEFTIRNRQKQSEDSPQLFGKIADEISQRFTKAGYPVNSSTSNPHVNPDEQPTYSHVMEAVVEDARLTATPVGISFDFGNSDPRATNFQKTLSAPITCTIKSLQDPAEQISLKELKSITTDMENIETSNPEKQEKIKRFYTENIGSTCHNLLSRLKIKPKAMSNAEPIDQIETFTPAIRIKTLYKPNIIKPEQQKSLTSTIPVEQDQQPPAIHTEQNSQKDWQNKEITIFNQGDTVILEFGNNRH